MSDKMLDKDNGLSWLKYDPFHGEEFIKINDEVDSWSYDSSIKKFISKYRPVSQYLITLLGSRNNIYYAYDNNNLAGVVLVAKPMPNYSFTTVEYIVVNPEMQGKGIGTRMISSLKSNPMFFAEGYKGNIDAFVNAKNIPSQKAFLKNKFKVFRRSSDINEYGGYYRFVYSEKIL